MVREWSNENFGDGNWLWLQEKISGVFDRRTTGKILCSTSLGKISAARYEALELVESAVSISL